MSRVGVRSEALRAASGAADVASSEVRCAAGLLLGAMSRCRPPPAPGLLASWVRLQASTWEVVGPGGLAGESLALEALGVRLGVVARAYEHVEAGVAAVMASVTRGADLAGRLGWFDDSGSVPVVRSVAPTWVARPFDEVADVVAAGGGLDGGHVRVVETAVRGGGSAWVVVVPGTQQWGPAAGSNPFDLTTDVRAVAGPAGAPTVAALGVATALDRARAASGRSSPDDPVLLVGHSQGGILAAALAADPGFVARHRVTHVVTTGAPVGLFPVPPEVHVLSVEHAADPVPGLDLTPNPARPSWLTLRTGEGPAVDPRRHDLGGYVDTLRPAPAGVAPEVRAWSAGADAFLGRPVSSVTEVVVGRGPPSTSSSHGATP